ncbi:MAG: glycine--tRNA ligase subunit beta [Candidatus Cloacimonetes bacterium]|nr:glycine--tRNA ligase subunit beta [Candidatus Cloacimonadota bacterium]
MSDKRQTSDFLLELGVEELPVDYIRPAITAIEQEFKNQLQTLKLDYSKIKTYSTPRRLAVIISDLQMWQKDEILERTGPAERVAYTPDGELSKAGSGFLRGAGASLSDLFIKETEKGRYIAVSKEIAGKPAKELLPEIIAELPGKIQFPKSMRWNREDTYFARPLRWLIALLDSEVLPCETVSIISGRQSYSTRYLSKRIEIESVATWEEQLFKVGVIVDRDERKEKIRQQLAKLFSDTNMRVREDERLLDVVTNIVESPTAVIADFNEAFLKLPEKIITSTLTQHQRYFAVETTDGILTSHFVFISNGDPKYSELIRHGNEKVVRARLADAQFYYEEDTAKPFEDFVPALGEVTFQADLGTMLEKTERIEKTVGFVSDSMPDEPDDDALRATRLCKADLVTNMLGEKEFTKLQGYIGAKYAAASGETEEVATAIYEHYMPRGQNDALPSSYAGALVSIADKLDTVCGIMGIGLIPTGSKDPFSIRRSANGVVQIIQSLRETHGFDGVIDLQELIEFSFALLENKLEKPNHNRDKVVAYFQQRVAWFLKERGIAYDVIESVTHIEVRDIPDLVRRAEALQKFRERDDFIRLVLAFKRVSNIIVATKTYTVFDENLLIEPSEKALLKAYLKLNSEVEVLLKKQNYTTILIELVKFGAVIDTFFDDVLVNTDDTNLRDNRYSLLNSIRQLFLQVADIAKIVVEGE